METEAAENKPVVANTVPYSEGTYTESPVKGEETTGGEAEPGKENHAAETHTQTGA
jgi:hypothetical protein